MRAILDTNVTVSALIWGGAPLRLLEAASEGQIDLVTSPALLAELARVLHRPHLAARLQLVRGDVDAAVALYAALAISVTPADVPRVVPDDPDDDQVIAAALAGSADIIVSGDRDLLSLGAYRDIKILPPAQAIAAISAGSP